jgi:integrase
MAPGIETRHSRGCPALIGGTCSKDDKTIPKGERCVPTFRAWVYSARDHKKIRETFSTEAAAKNWRDDKKPDARRGKLRVPTARTVSAAWVDWYRFAEAGTIRKRNGETYAASTLRGYEQAMTLRLLPELGGRKLASVAPADILRIVEQMLGAERDPSTIRNTVNALRAVYRRECGPLGSIPGAVNPTQGLELPSVDSKRDRIAEPYEAARLLAALPANDRALWATACYAGLRLGELQALEYDRENGLDLAGGWIHVRCGWDPRNGRIRPKSKAGIRDVPIAGVLRDYLDEHKARTERERGLVYGRTETRPFNPSTLYERAERAWAIVAVGAFLRGESLGIDSIRPHELRHTAVSLWIASHIPAKHISVWAGHHSVAFTLDRYGHLFERFGHPEIAKLDEFLARADSMARLEQLR